MPHTDTPTPASASLAEHGLILRELTQSGDSAAENPAVARQYRTVERGFYEEPPTGEALDQWLGLSRQDGRRYLGVYPADADPAQTDPVGTFVDFVKGLHVGGGREVPAWLISNVTVAPTHRRRGILRAMMTESLQAAVDRGHPVAALTASEGGIYARFGFGVANSFRSVEIDVKDGLPLRGPAPTGSVRLVEPRELDGLGDELYRRAYLQTPGSVERTASYRMEETDTNLHRNGGKGTGLFAAVHHDDGGRPRGFVTYRFAGWEKSPQTMEVQSLITTTAQSHRALWQFLGSLDLIERITWKTAPDDGLLEAMMVDRRRIRTTFTQDRLWLRVLDVPAALSARPWSQDGSILLTVTDSMGWAEGTWRVDVVGGEATVSRAESTTAPDLSMDVAELGSVWLGGISPEVLRQAALVTEHRSGAVAELGRMLAQDRPVHSMTGF